jgi:hypothetical protein
MGNPWEIQRNDVSYPVRFYGEVISGPDGAKQWTGGESILAVAYDVPIPGYKTRTTINLRLWSTKVSTKEFDLKAFNTGDHAKAYAVMKNAEKVCGSLVSLWSLHLHLSSVSSSKVLSGRFKISTTELRMYCMNMTKTLFSCFKL